MFTSKILYSLAVIAAVLGAGSLAQAQHMNAPDAPCKEAGSGADQASCLSRAAKKADADLNGAYQRIAAVLSAKDRQNLQNAERTWLLYRDQTCAAEHDLYGGGTGGNSAYPACLEAVTRHRIAELKSAYWWKVEKFGGSSVGASINTSLIDGIIRNLDLTSFPNSVGPRRITGKTSFADYGFVRVEKTEDGANLEAEDKGWIMGFRVISAGPQSLQLCFTDRGEGRPGDVSAPSYNATSALVVSRMPRGTWAAKRVPEGFSSSKNDPPPS